MKICHVITGLSVGGAEMMLLKLLQHRQRSDLDHEVISLIPPGPLASRLDAEDVRVHSLNWRRGLPSPLELARLSKLTRELAPDAVQGWMYHGNLAALWIKRAAGAKVRLYWNIRHSLSDLKHEKWLTRQVIRAGARFSHRPDRILYNSETSARQHEARGYEGAGRLVIPNGFDTTQMKPMPESRSGVRARFNIPDEAFVIGIVARNHPMKDFPGFLRAAGLFGRKHPDAHFLLAGRGVDQGNAGLTRWIDADMAARFHMAGERNDVDELMNAMDLFCLNSAWGEAFPNVLGEAMACGVPCVSTDVGDAAAIIGDTGLVVRPLAPAELAEAWAKLRSEGSDSLKRRGAAARKRIVDNYRIETIVGRYEALYLGSNHQ